VWDFGYHNEITKFLKGKRKSKVLPDFEPYFEPLTEPTHEEVEKYGLCSVAHFRSLGYTVGHVIVDKDMIIKDIIVYNKPTIQDYKGKYSTLQKEMVTLFLGKKLILKKQKTADEKDENN
jgi:hypothetical protein